MHGGQLHAVRKGRVDLDVMDYLWHEAEVTARPAWRPFRIGALAKWKPSPDEDISAELILELLMVGQRLGMQR
jgi:hypothetical protein